MEIKIKDNVPRRQTIGLSNGGILTATQQYIFANQSFFFSDKVIYIHVYSPLNLKEIYSLTNKPCYQYLRCERSVMARELGMFIRKE